VNAAYKILSESAEFCERYERYFGFFFRSQYISVVGLAADPQSSPYSEA
jgi:hypothetical protein